MSTDANLTELPIVAIDPVVPPPPKPRVWTVFLALFVGLALTVVVQIVVVAGFVTWQISQGVKPDEMSKQLSQRLSTPMMFILLAAGAQVSFLAAAVVPAWLSPVPLRERLGLLPTQMPWTVYPLAAMASLFPLAIGFSLAGLLTLILPADPSVAHLFENMSLPMFAAFILFIATVPAVVEELLFRGYLQRRLLERWSPTVAIGVTSVLFALYHVMPHAIVAVLPVGIWFGVVAWRTGSVYPGILCHAFVNGSVNLYRLIVKFLDVSQFGQIAIIIVTLVLATICFIKLVRDFSRPSGEVIPLTSLGPSQ